MKKDHRLYNMILPPFMLWGFVPWMTTVAIVGNFIIDSVVLLILSAVFFKKADWRFYINCIFKIWIFGFLADVIGWLFLFIIAFTSHASYVGDDSLAHQIESGVYFAVNHGNSFYNIWSFLYLFCGVLIAGVLIFVLDYFISFNRTSLTKKQRIKAALSFAVFTAPYTFLLPSPSEWFF